MPASIVEEVLSRSLMFLAHQQACESGVALRFPPHSRRSALA
jgi:hypothetical protein